MDSIIHSSRVIWASVSEPHTSELNSDSSYIWSMLLRMSFDVIAMGWVGTTIIFIQLKIYSQQTGEPKWWQFWETAKKDSQSMHTNCTRDSSRVWHLGEDARVQVFTVHIRGLLNSFVDWLMQKVCTDCLLWLFDVWQLPSVISLRCLKWWLLPFGFKLPNVTCKSVTFYVDTDNAWAWLTCRCSEIGLCFKLPTFVLTTQNYHN